MKKKLLFVMLFLFLASLIPEVFSREYEPVFCTESGYCYMNSKDGDAWLINDPKPAHYVLIRPRDRFSAIKEKTYIKKGNTIVLEADDFKIEKQKAGDYDEFSYEFSSGTIGLTTGEYTFSTVLMDTFSLSETPPYTFIDIIDITAPTIDKIELYENGVLLDHNDIEQDSNITIKIKALDEDGIPDTGVIGINISFLGINQPMIYEGNNIYSIDLNLNLGQYTVNFYAYDNLTNVNPVSYEFSVSDKKGPRIGLYHPIDGFVYTSPADLIFNTSEDATCNLYNQLGDQIGTTSYGPRLHTFYVHLNKIEEPNEYSESTFNISCEDLYNNPNHEIIKITYSILMTLITRIESSRGEEMPDGSKYISSYEYSVRITDLEVDTTVNTYCKYIGAKSPFIPSYSDYNELYEQMKDFGDGLSKSHSVDLTAEIEITPEGLEAATYDYYALCKDSSNRFTSLNKTKFTVDIPLTILETSPSGIITDTSPELRFRVNSDAYCRYKQNITKEWIDLGSQKRLYIIPLTSPLEYGSYSYDVECSRTYPLTDIVATSINFSVIPVLIAPVLWELPSETEEASIDIIGYTNEANSNINIFVIDHKTGFDYDAVTEDVIVKEQQFKGEYSVKSKRDDSSINVDGTTYWAINFSESEPSYVEFSGHDDIYFKRYKVVDKSDSILLLVGKAWIKFDRDFVEDVKADESFKVYDTLYPEGWFNVTVTLGVNANNSIIAFPSYLGIPGQNVTTAGPIYFHINPPVLDSNIPGVVGQPQINISGHAKPLSNVMIYHNNSLGQVVKELTESSSDRSFSGEITLTSGENHIYAVVVDQSNNSISPQSDELSIIYDDKAPVFEDPSPIGTDLARDDVEIVVYAWDNIGLNLSSLNLKIDDSEVEPFYEEEDLRLRISYTMSFITREHTIEASIEDSVGNLGEYNWSFTTYIPPQCVDGIDNDNDSLVDYMRDPGCDSQSDNDEFNPSCESAISECWDCSDNDGDTLIDYMLDPGCDNIYDNDESNIYECNDNLDNDLDACFDMDDLDCSSMNDDYEGGTDCRIEDTDSDGLSDYRETNIYNTDPTNPDSDGDGFSDGAEVTSGSDPNDPESKPTDTDGDGLDDNWEMAYFGDLNEDGGGDYDNDGLNNMGEYQHGTDPTDPDTDGDGLNDGQEINIGTNPNDVDTDGDGLNDGQEVNIGTDPTNPDSDNDGLNDGQEVNIGTDPINPDSDNDGLTDGDEIDSGTDPLDQDTDDDGLTDYEEVIDYGTDPTDPDSDKDGLNDKQEIEQEGTDPTDPDSDNDGLNDGQEIEQGTDPTNPDSDGDGFSDGAEVTSGSDPNDPESKPTDTDGDGLDDNWEMAYFGDLNEDGGGDYDNDGLNNMGEYQHGTDPTNPDTDGDGLNDGQEINIGTNPNDVDTDGDGLNDGQEVNIGTNPTDPDSDNDGLTDKQEINYNTDPNDIDTDDDGLNDKQEIDQGTDPTDPDSDNDGLNDGQEIEQGTDPTNPDSDGDGFSDGAEVTSGSDPNDPESKPTDTDGDGLDDNWEMAYFGNLNEYGNGDYDNDGLNNKDEYQYGTDPTDPDSDNDGLTDNEEINIHKTDPLNYDTDEDGCTDGDELNLYNTDPTNSNDCAISQCNDDEDNDGDGLVDYGFTVGVNDPGCDNLTDNDETDFAGPPEIKEFRLNGVLVRNGDYFDETVNYISWTYGTEVTFNKVKIDEKEYTTGWSTQDNISYSFSVNLGLGSHTISFTATNLVAQTTQTISFNVDTIAPTVTIDNWNLEGAQYININGRCGDNLYLASLELRVDGSIAEFPPKCINGYYNVGANLGVEREHTITITAIDRAGNSNSSTIVVDTSIPNIDVIKIVVDGIVLEEPYRTNKEKVTIIGTYEDEHVENVGISVLLNENIVDFDISNYTAGPDIEAFKINVTLEGEDGEEFVNNITIIARDKSDLDDKEHITIIKDLRGPLIVEFEPETYVTSEIQPTINIITDEEAENCWINYTSKTTSQIVTEQFYTENKTHFSITFDGMIDYNDDNSSKTQDIVIYCEDVFSNLKSHTIQFTIDQNKPVIDDFYLYYGIPSGVLELLDTDDRKDYAIVIFDLQNGQATNVLLRATTNEDTRCRYYGSSSGQFRNYDAYTMEHETDGILIYDGQDYSYNIECEDKAGIKADVKTVGIEADSSYEAGQPIIAPEYPPMIGIPILSSLSIVFNGSIIPPAGYSITESVLSINDQAYDLGKGGRYSQLVELPSDGNYTYDIWAAADNDKNDTKTGQIIVDTTGPSGCIKIEGIIYCVYPEEFVSTQTICTDSDDGRNYYAKGYVTMPDGMILEDICISDTYLQERVCNSDTNYLENTERFSCPKGCKDGVCLREAVEEGCTDSDDGKDYYVKGDVAGITEAGEPYTKGDFCVSENELGEYYCDGVFPVYSSYICPNGCQDGACIS